MSIARRFPLSIANMRVAAAVACVAGVAFVAAANRADVDPKWIDRRIEQVDRAFFDNMVGYAPPAFTKELVWIGVDPMTWEGLRGRVVVIQSWTSKTSVGRMWGERVVKVLGEQDPNDVVVLALHTPEGAETAKQFVESQPLGATVVVDPTGAFCDELGIYRQPVNVVIGRNGEVRFAGLTPDGLKSAVAQLQAETATPSAKPKARPSDNRTLSTKPASAPAKPAAAAPSGDFPPHNKSRISAQNKQGQTAPAIEVQEWLGAQPSTDGKVVVVDFWATWCGPCVAAIPHMNDLAKKYADQVAIIGISSEPASTVRGFMKKKPMNYGVAIDQRNRLNNWFGVQGIPHVVVMSPDRVVRWQGHPAQLDNALLDQIIAASGVGQGGAGGADAPADSPAKKRWTSARKP